ncbi:FMN-dependent dehydrogenase [Stachybotrys elegans]|uniref:FMN-dependent dehydrogenase n=1 Tax=Stachybotrys elegans TaxID=80388 RepID=A0A8K0SI31_9HYPO|nr:FMN-dependent dehydrogenase [Stachybotrys elegans]
MYRSLACVSQLFAAALAATNWVNEPDTGLEDYIFSTNYTEGSLPLLKDMRAIPDFDWVARQVMDNQMYSFYRVAAAGETSYRNNLEVWSKVKFRPKVLANHEGLNETLSVSILGYNFSAPFFISPATRANYGDPERAEINFVDAAAEENILYVSALYANKTIEEIGAAKRKHNATMNGPLVTFQQIYTNANLSVTWDAIARAEAANAKAIVWTVDAPGSSTRHRAARYDTTNANSVTSYLSWDLYDQMKERTSLPIILKGITNVEDALEAVERGVPAIWLSNHGGRQVEHSPSPLEVAYEIHRNAPQVFKQVEVLADSGVRYGSDVLKLLALGVKAVGMGRPFMYSNLFGPEGPKKVMKIMKDEILNDAAQLGITDLRNIDLKRLNTRILENEVYLMDN